MTTTQVRKRGGQPKNRNAFRHGRYSRERIALLAEVRAHVKRTKELTQEAHSKFASREVVEK